MNYKLLNWFDFNKKPLICGVQKKFVIMIEFRRNPFKNPMDK